MSLDEFSLSLLTFKGPASLSSKLSAFLKLQYYRLRGDIDQEEQINGLILDTLPHDIDRAELMKSVHLAQALKANNEIELNGLLAGLSGKFIPAAPGGDIIRDGVNVLPTGRNIYALDPYRIPSSLAYYRGKQAAELILKAHQDANLGDYPETVAVTLWGLDTIKTKGESVGIVLGLVGAEPITEATGRIVGFKLIPLEKLGRPRIDVLTSLSGIFRDSFENVLDILDKLFEVRLIIHIHTCTK